MLEGFPRRIADRYAIEGEIGAGGMGVVVRARDEKLDRAVAIKLLSKPFLGNANARARLLREAISAAALHHPGIVQVFDVGELPDGGAYLVMELLRGRSVGAALAEGHLSLAERQRIVVETARILAFSHAQGFVHRDVKPDNVMLRDDGRVAVLDFGLAKCVDLASTNLTPSDAVAAKTLTTEGTIVGSPGYMAPEQIVGDEVGPAADQFGLGVTAYELFTGRLPWKGGNVIKLMTQVVHDAPPPASSIVPSLPEALDRLLERAMAKRPEDRFASMTELADALAQIPLTGAETPRRVSVDAETVAVPAPAIADSGARRSGGGEAARDSAARDSAARDSAARDSAARTAPAPATAPASRRNIAVTLGVAVVAVLAAVAFANRRSPGERPPAAPGPAASSTPLSDPASVLACPVLRASGADEPSGWLGAAVATMACQRARVILGKTERALAPADLLDLPREPSEGAPADPFGAEDARDRSLRAARERAAAYLDGTVRKEGLAFSVSLTLTAADGRVLAEGAGKGGLAAAVRAAMEPLRAPSALPDGGRAPALWTGTSDADALLARLDMSYAGLQLGPSFPTECDRTRTFRAALGASFATVSTLCTYAQGLPAPDEPAPAIDRTSPGRFAATVEARLMMGALEDVRAAADEARRMREAAADPRVQAQMLVVESCLHQALDDNQGAHDLALQAVHQDVAAEDGLFCSRLDQLLSTSTKQPNAPAVLKLAQAWRPWSSLAWFSLQGAFAEDPTELSNLGRAHLLAPYHTEIADHFARALLLRGQRERARAVAAALAGGPPAQRAASALIGTRIQASETAFGEALAAARHHLASTDGSGHTASLRVDLAVLAVRLGMILGRGREVADEATRMLVDPDPPALAVHSADGSTAAVGLCLHGTRTRAAPCLARVRSLLQKSYFAGPLPGSEAVLDGADAYARGDLAAAARLWRPLVRKSPVVLLELADVLSEAFDASGDADLAQRADEAERTFDGELGGASMATVRMARRAARDGDHETAARLARAVIDAWRASDEPVPAVAEMRKIAGAGRP